MSYLNTAVHLLALQWGVCDALKIVDLTHTHTPWVKWDCRSVCRQCTAVLWYILWLHSQWATGYSVASEVTPPLPRHREQSARIAGQEKPLNPRSQGRWLVKVSSLLIFSTFSISHQGRIGVVSGLFAWIAGEQWLGDSVGCKSNGLMKIYCQDEWLTCGTLWTITIKSSRNKYLLLITKNTKVGSWYTSWVYTKRAHSGIICII